MIDYLHPQWFLRFMLSIVAGAVAMAVIVVGGVFMAERCGRHGGAWCAMYIVYPVDNDNPPGQWEKARGWFVP